MKIYTTLHPKDFKEYFGDDYILEERSFINKRVYKKFPIEHYYHQEIKDDDVFLLTPQFSQVCLVHLMEKDRVNPTYITMYKGEEKPSDPFFEKVGAVCPVDDVFQLFKAVQELHEVVKTHSHLPSLFESASFYDEILENQDQKKTLNEIKCSVSTSSFPSINNLDYVPVHLELLTGTRGLIKKSGYKSLNKFIFFEHADIKYYCALTPQKAYFFINGSNYDRPPKKILIAIDNYINIDILYKELRENGKDGTQKGAKVKKERQKATDKLNSLLLTIHSFKEEKDKVKEELERQLEDVIKAEDEEKVEAIKCSIAKVQKEKKSFYMKVEAPSDKNLETYESFLPIPISDEQLYQEFYFFIKLAVNKQQLQTNIVDTWDTKVSITIDSYDKGSYEQLEPSEKDENQEDISDHDFFYTAYCLYFLSLYIDEVNKLSEEIKSTLSEIIPHLAFKKYNNSALTMIFNFLKQKEGFYKPKKQEEIKSGEAGKMKLLLDAINKEENKVGTFFAEDKKNKENIQKYLEIIRSEIGNPLLKHNKNKKIIDKQIKIQSKLLDKDNKCLNEKQKKLIQGNVKGRKFNNVNIYLDPTSVNTIYYDLSPECQEEVDKYFKLYDQWIKTESDLTEGEVRSSNISFAELTDNDLEKKINLLNNSILAYSKLSTKDMTDYSFEEIEIATNFPLHKFINNFLESYQNLPTNFPISAIKKREFIQVFYIYIIQTLGSASGKRDEVLQADLDYIRNELLILSNSKYTSYLTDYTYNEWITSFFQRIQAQNIIEWLNNGEGLELENPWSELRKRIINPSLHPVHQFCELELPKNKKDRRLEQSKSKDHMQVYAQTIIDIYDLLNNNKDKDIETLVQNLNKSKKHQLFKTFLTRDSSLNNMHNYLSTVVYEPNKENYFNNG